MGHYLNPPDDVKIVGRKLEVKSNPTFESMASQLNANEDLYFLGLRLDMGFKNAVHIFDAEEFTRFAEQVKQGIILFEGMYAVPLEKSQSYKKQVRIEPKPEVVP